MEGREDPGVTRNPLKPAQRERAAEAGNSHNPYPRGRALWGINGGKSLSVCAQLRLLTLSLCIQM